MCYDTLILSSIIFFFLWERYVWWTSSCNYHHLAVLSSLLHITPCPQYCVLQTPTALVIRDQHLIHSFIHSFIPLARAECNDSLPFSGASSIPLCYVVFPATLPHQLFFHPLSPHLAICFLVYLSILLFPNSYIILSWEFYLLPFSVHVQTNVIYERRLIRNAHSEISRKRDHVFKRTKVGSKVQYFSYKLTYLFFDIVALSFITFFPT